MITSKSNAQLKRIRLLIESSKERSRTGLFVAEGERLIGEIPEELIADVYVSESYEREHGRVKIAGKDAVSVADGLFKGISDTVNPQGILAVARQPSYNLMELASGGELFLLLDDIQDPGNLGTMIRTAEAAGAAVIMSEGCVDVFNPKVIRSTMGSIFRVPFAVCGIPRAAGLLKERGVTVCAAAPSGGVSRREAPVKGKCAFIIGNEANGVSEEALSAADIRVSIPMKGRVESLNAAVSAALLLYGRY